MDSTEMQGALEAIIFANGDPLTKKDLEKIIERLYAEQPEDVRAAAKKEIGPALDAVKERWQAEARGFQLVEVAEGFTFRSNPRFADALLAMREERPVKLSRAALETMAIVAYRQPVTKPEIDHIRGVDCGATIRLLLDRNLVRIVGKREEPGRPLLYGTSKEFLSFFNLGSLAELPTLREFSELTQDSQEELSTFDAQALEELKQSAKTLKLDDDAAVGELDQAMHQLKTTEKNTREALAAQGVQLVEEQEPPATPEPATGT
jgi:segregation and condensation protein B